MSPAGDGAVAVLAENRLANYNCGDEGKSECLRTSEIPSHPVLWGIEESPWTHNDKLRRIVSASIKGFSIGAGLKGGLALFSILSRLRRTYASSLRKTEALSNSEAIALAGKETLRYGMFLAAFAGTFSSVDEIIATLYGHRRTAKWRALVAGLLAGPSMLLTGWNTQHKSLAIYILMRAAVLVSRCGMKSKRFGSFCKPLTWKHGDIFLMCLSTSQILLAYMLKRDSLPKSYRLFLIKHGGKDPVLLEALREMACSNRVTHLGSVEKFYQSLHENVEFHSEMKVPCPIIHGNQSCTGHALSFFVAAYNRALQVYLPVYLIPALIVHRQDLLKSPYTILRKGLFGTARSSLFLSVYCSSAWAMCCFWCRLLRKISVPILGMSMFPVGAALGIEKKSRRIEISLYCFARAIESFITSMADLGYLAQFSKLKRLDVAIFSISTAIIMHCYAHEREVFRSKYLNVLDWVFGVPPPQDETPRGGLKEA